MSLFIGGLAFADPLLIEEAKLGKLASGCADRFCVALLYAVRLELTLEAGEALDVALRGEKASADLPFL